MILLDGILIHFINFENQIQRKHSKQLKSSVQKCPIQEDDQFKMNCKTEENNFCLQDEKAQNVIKIAEFLIKNSKVKKRKSKKQEKIQGGYNNKVNIGTEPIVNIAQTKINRLRLPFIQRRKSTLKNIIEKRRNLNHFNTQIEDQLKQKSQQIQTDIRSQINSPKKSSKAIQIKNFYFQQQQKFVEKKVLRKGTSNKIYNIYATSTNHNTSSTQKHGSMRYLKDLQQFIIVQRKQRIKNENEMRAKQYQNYRIKYKVSDLVN